MIIHTYERSGRGEALSELLGASRTTERFSKIIVLPIPTTIDGKNLKSTDIPLTAVPPLAGKGSLVVGYGIPEELKEELLRVGATVCDSAKDEEFLLENAELTSLATLGILLSTSDRAIADMVVGVVGYGRIGKRLVNSLLYHGACVRVYTTRNDTRLDLCSTGISAKSSTPDSPLVGLDALINTAPAVIFDTGRQEFKNLRIIDLASGDNFPGVEGVEKYPSIPARVFPYSAGKIWFRSVERFLCKQ